MTIPSFPNSSPQSSDSSSINLLCGHTTRDHEIDALCPRHPRNEGVRLHSHSELKTYKRCKRKWWLQWYRGLTSQEPSPVGALAIGDRLHRALREWYVPESVERTDPRDALEVFITADWTALSQNTSEISSELHQQFTSEADLERVMLDGYMEWLEETGADHEFVVTAPETYLEVEISDDLIPSYSSASGRTKLIGKLDVRVKRIRDGVRQFIDHKSVGVNLSTVASTLQRDEQMLHYHLLENLSTQQGEERCSSALYNMLRKVKRTVRSKPPYYQRVEIVHNIHEIESYRTRVLATVEDLQIAEAALNNKQSHLRWAYPNPTRDCSWDCPFSRVCTMFDDGSRVEAMLEQDFVPKDVLDYYVKDTGLRSMIDSE